MHALKLLPVSILTLVTYLAIDPVRLGLIVRNMYRSELSHLLAPNARWLLP